MIIRDDLAADILSIRFLITEAFRSAPHGSGTEAAIVEALRSAEALTLSLVAVEDSGEIVGHVAFSPVLIDGGDAGWFGLGPVAVKPDRQRRGIGARLVRNGLDRLRETGAHGVVVLGDPVYYGRFGFRVPSNLRLPNVPAEYFMALGFGLAAPSGTVEYHSAFSATG